MKVSIQPADRIYRRKQQILSAAVDDEIVMMSVEKGQYYNLNVMGTRIWHLLETPRSVVEVVMALDEIYDVPEEKIRDEVDAFLTRLERAGLLELVTTGKT